MRFPRKRRNPCPGATVGDLLAFAGPAAGKTHVVFDEHELIRVEYERGGEHRAAWVRLTHSPVETLVPSVLWFFLKIGLFVVGALVFWKRPDDRSAAQFFLLCIVSLGAYMGGYHWSRIVTQPVLLLVFMVCAACCCRRSACTSTCVFPRPKAFC